MIGSLKGGLAGAVWGAVGAFAAYTGAELAGRLAGIGSETAHTASLLKSGLTKLVAIKALLHGLSSGIINYFRGGSFRAGLFSGIGSAFDIGTKGYGTMVGRTSIMAIIGGTFAKLGGGKFANGALSAAFTHLFNAEAKAASINEAFEKLDKAHKFYEGLSSLGDNVEASKALYQLQQALSAKDLNKALEAYTKLYDLIPNEFKLFPIKPEAIMGAASAIQKKQFERFMFIANGPCLHNLSCLKHYYHPPH